MAEMRAATDTVSRAAGPADLAGDIGRRLATHRARRGVRVAELAREVGVTPSLISQIERGQSRPSVSTLFALAQALDVPVDAFFREPGPAVPSLAPATASEAAGGPEPGGGPGPGPAGPRPGSWSGPAGQQAEGRYVVRRGNRAAIDIDGGVRWERLTPETLRHLDFFELVYGPGAQSNPTLYSHPGTEMVLITTGALEISVGFETYRLEPGDSMQFPSSMPHRYANPAIEPARAVTVIFYDCPADAVQAPPHA
jgi:DNA-binding XRE family transcriptional regulator/mannose-6-phosphate isomerase-like protein (cupin superfamily)